MELQYQSYSPRFLTSRFLIGKFATPDANTERMNRLAAGLSSMLEPDDLAIMVLDNAGWHRSKSLKLPANIVLLPRPPYSPELNPTEIE